MKTKTYSRLELSATVVRNFKHSEIFVILQRKLKVAVTVVMVTRTFDISRKGTLKLSATVVRKTEIFGISRLGALELSATLVRKTEIFGNSRKKN